MTNVATSAQNLAMVLHQSRNSRALHHYLEQWKLGHEVGSVDYILSVVHHYSVLQEHSIRPDLMAGSLRLNFSTQRATWKNVDLQLTVTEFRVVKVMADDMDVWMTYRTIYDVIHYVGFAAGVGVEGYKTNVRSIIKRVRRKFENVDPGFNQIENYNGHGYRWRKAEPVIPVEVPHFDQKTDVAVFAK